MFRALARNLAGNGAATVLSAHPLRLSRWLEERWEGAQVVPPFGIPPNVGTLADVLGDAAVLAGLSLPPPPPTGSGFPWPPAGTPVLWDQMIYAHLIESTGAYEILGEVVRRYGLGETLDQLDLASNQWLRSTEDLFFSDPPLFSIAGVGSQLRPDSRVTRRNAYWRMFQMDLPHPIPARWAPSGQPWKNDTGSGVNADFCRMWSEFLRQVWLGLRTAATPAAPMLRTPSISPPCV